MNLLVMFLPLLIGGLTLKAETGPHDKDTAQDGPYVVYRNQQVEVHRIVVEDGVQKAKVQTFPEKDKARVSVEVEFSDHPAWNFSVKLQPQLRNEPAEFKQPDKILALSDIEGEFKALRDLLLANKVMDEQYKWTFGNGHLVICGDLFDRGKEVPAVIWLLYKLEQEAKLKGGYLHTILGNHDIMNLSGDLRYVKEKYFDNARLMGFDYMDLYAENTELGRWLRSKNLVEKIGDNLCLHAGISPGVNDLQMGLQQINDKCRPFYDKAKEKKSFADPAVFKFFDGTRTSLFWYRGYFSEPKISKKEIDQTLQLYHVERIIVGHTIVKSNVGFYYNGKVLGIDVNQHEGDHEGALYENKKWYKVNTTGGKELLSF